MVDLPDSPAPAVNGGEREKQQMNESSNQRASDITNLPSRSSFTSRDIRCLSTFNSLSILLDLAAADLSDDSEQPMMSTVENPLFRSRRRSSAGGASHENFS